MAKWPLEVLFSSTRQPTRSSCSATGLSWARERDPSNGVVDITPPIVTNRQLRTAGPYGPKHLPEDPSASPVGYDQMAQEISALPQIETVISLMPDAAVVVDGKGNIVSINGRAQKLFGYEKADLVGRSIETLVPERFRQSHQRDRARYHASPRSRSMGTGLELYARRQDGSEFPVDIMLAPVEGGQVIAAVRDITERKAAEAARAELAAIVQSSKDGILSMSDAGVITSWNPGAEQMFGFRPKDVIGRHIGLLFPDDPVLEEMLETARRGQSPPTRDTRWQTSAGRAVDVAISVSPLAGKEPGFSVLVRDITERLAAEVRLQRQARWLAATAEIRLSLLSEEPLTESLTVLCRWAAELGGGRATAVLLAERGRAQIAARAGEPEDLLPLGPLARTPTLVAQAMASGRIEQGRMSIVPGLAARAFPIASPGKQDERVGCLVVLRDETAHLDEHALEVLSGLASQASLALELAAVRAERDRLLISADRERIARDLHDLVIQRLFGAGLRLQGALSLIDNQPAASRVASTIDDLDTTIKEIREAIFALESAPGTSLRSRILETVADATEALGFRPLTSFHGLDGREVSLQVQLELTAVLREALSNVARHANASKVEVHVTLDDALELLVSDNGVGIGHPEHLSGIANARARAELLGGSLQVSGVPPREGGGTCFEWRVPVGS
jgi:PAS domain S-box-containing protein